MLTFYLLFADKFAAQAQVCRNFFAFIRSSQFTVYIIEATFLAGQDLCLFLTILEVIQDLNEKSLKSIVQSRKVLVQ